MDNGSKPPDKSGLGSFDASQYIVNIENRPGKPERLYLHAKHRIMWLRHQSSDIRLNHDFGIETEELEHDRDAGYAKIKATIRCRKDGFILAQGTKTETKEDFKDYYEVAETGSIARAASNCGWGTQFALEAHGHDLEGVAGRPADAPVEGIKSAPEKVQKGQLQLMGEMIAQHGLTKEFCKERWGDSSTFTFEQAGDVLEELLNWQTIQANEQPAPEKTTEQSPEDIPF